MTTVLQWVESIPVRGGRPLRRLIVVDLTSWGRRRLTPRSGGGPSRRS